MKKIKDRKTGLKFIAMSGTIGVTENFYIYEYGQDMIVVDCGVGFPDPDMFGVDLVIPDMSYITENAHKLRGIVITHGHEDHLGAIPFLLDKVNVPVYATPLTAGFIKDKLDDYGVTHYQVNTIDADKDVIKLGVFKLTPFRVTHSVPDTAGFAIDTPEGLVMHVSDYKFDWTPVTGKPFDVSKAASLASQGVLMLASDCLGSTSPGYTVSEREIEGRIEQIVDKAQNQVFFTTISSNISRMQQAINVAEKAGRQVCLIGRSIVTKAEIAKNLGYLNYSNKTVISPKHAGKLLKNKILYIISGSYGQPGSALYRVAMSDHPFLKIEENDTIIFSGDPAPPGSKTNVDFLVDRFLELNTDVHYYDMQEDLHVSGHGSRQDIFMLFGIIKPKYYVPIGGTIRHMRAYKKMAMEMGATSSEVMELMPGDGVEYVSGNANKLKRLRVESVLVDGLGVGDVGNVVLRDRKKLSQDGIAIVIIQMDANGEKLIADPEIISRGFVFEKNTKDFLNKSGKMLGKKLLSKRVINAQQLKTETVDILERFFYAKTGRRPMVLPVVVEV